MTMTLVEFLNSHGLLLQGENKVAQMKALTAEDKAWFAARAKIEFNIEIVSAVLVKTAA